jgi:hypothetical protein
MLSRLSRRLVCVVLLLIMCESVLFLSSCSGVAGSSSTFSLVGSPSVTASFIDRVLVDHHSPAQGLGHVFYDLGVQYGIDPVFPLGFFHVESNYGLAGEAVQSLSIGNMRCLPDYLCRDGYAWFPSWSEGIKAWYKLIAGPLYVGSGLTTLQAVLARYAPSSDSNNDSVYVQSVVQLVTAWRAGQES